MKRDDAAANGSLLKDLITIDPKTGLDLYPHWLAQPYFRPLPPNKKNVDGLGQYSIICARRLLIIALQVAEQQSSFGVKRPLTESPASRARDILSPLAGIDNTEAKRARLNTNDS